MTKFYKIYIYCIIIIALSLSGCNSGASNGQLASSQKLTQSGQVYLASIPDTDFMEEIQDSLPLEDNNQPLDSDDILAEPTETENNEQAEIDYETIKPNEIGQIMIIMYHKIVTYPTSSNYERNISDFKADLQRLYEEGYRLTTMESLITNRIEVPAGYSPLVLTFDDGWSNAFSLTEADGRLIPTENCAVDILNEFCNTYPDFGKGAVFYINGYQSPFNGDGTVAQRLAYLVDNGYELGNHTYSHSNLSKLNAESIQNEILSLDLFVKHELPDYKMLSMCYPYGSRPQPELHNYALEGEYNTISYSYQWALREGPSNGIAAPNHKKFDPLNIPRIRGTSNANMDLGWFFDYYNTHPDLRYISDGNPNVISVPNSHADDVNTDSLNDKMLNTY